MGDCWVKVIFCNTFDVVTLQVRMFDQYSQANSLGEIQMICGGDDAQMVRFLRFLYLDCERITSARISRYIFIFLYNPILNLTNLQLIQIIKDHPSQLIIFILYHPHMVFYGIRTVHDQQLTQLLAEAKKLSELRQIKNQTRLSTLDKQFNISSLCAKLGTAITQGILSTQFVFRCIGTYFQREWVNYYLDSFQPLINQYNKLPQAFTQIKYTLANKYSFEDRLLMVNLVTSIVFARNIRPSLGAVVMTSGKMMATFGMLSFLALPQYGQHIIDSFATHIY